MKVSISVFSVQHCSQSKKGRGTWPNCTLSRAVCSNFYVGLFTFDHVIGPAGSKANLYILLYILYVTEPGSL